MNTKAIKKYYQQMETLKKKYERDAGIVRGAMIECGALDVHQHHDGIVVQVSEEALSDIPRDGMENVDGVCSLQTGTLKFWHVTFDYDGVRYNYTRCGRAR